MTRSHGRGGGEWEPPLRLLVPRRGTATGDHTVDQCVRKLMFDDLRIVEPHSLELRDLLQTKEQKGCTSPLLSLSTTSGDVGSAR